MQVAVFQKRWIQVRKAARDRIAKCMQDRLCVACMQEFKEGEEPIRGCHVRCYHATRRAIASEKTTDAERVQAGRLLERQAPGRKPSNPVSVEVA